MKHKQLLPLLFAILFSIPALAQLPKKQWFDAKMNDIASKKERKTAAFVRTNEQAQKGGIYSCRIARADGSIFQEFQAEPVAPHHKTGTFKEYNQAGKVLVEETWAGGRKEGVARYFGDDGVMVMMGHYKENIAHGYWEYHHDGGADKGKLNNNLREGWWDIWKDGQSIRQYYHNNIPLGDVNTNKTTLARVGIEVRDVNHKAERLYGLMNQQGELVVPCIYDILWHAHDTVFQAKDTLGNWGIISSSGRVLLPFEYRQINKGSGGFRLERAKDRKWGFMNKEVEVIVPCKYDDIHYLHSGRIAAQKGSKWGYLDENGQVAIPFLYKEACDFAYGTGYVVLASGKGHRISPTGKIEGPWTDHKYGCPEDELLIDTDVDIARKFAITTPIGEAVRLQISFDGGVVNDKGVYAIEPIYDELGEYRDGIMPAKNGERWGAINDLGEVVIPFEYVYMSAFRYPSQ